VLLERCRIDCPRILAGLSKRLADAQAVPCPQYGQYVRHER
jgi:hypothetical protein